MEDENSPSVLLEAAIGLHEMFLTLIAAGFTEYQALIMVVNFVKPDPK